MKFHRILSTTAAVAVLSTAIVTSPAVAKVPEGNAPIMRNADELSVDRGVDGWVNILLASTVDLENVRIFVEEDKKGTEVIYPANGSSTGLSEGSLPAMGTDYASFMLMTTGDSPDEFDLTIIAEWTEGDQLYRSEIGEIEVELREHNGRDYDFLSEDATVSTTGEWAGWVEMDFRGIAPINSDFEVKVKEGLDDEYYPQGNYTSLHHNARLDGGETDVARIWIDPETLEVGDTYTVEIEVKYENNEGKDKKNKHEMTLTVIEAEVE
jgi:hypothetical protein